MANKRTSHAHTATPAWKCSYPRFAAAEHAGWQVRRVVEEPDDFHPRHLLAATLYTHELALVVTLNWTLSPTRLPSGLNPSSGRSQLRSPYIPRLLPL